MDFKNDLNEEQFAAVTAPIGPALVLAGAGSGKTRTLIYRVAWLLSQGIKPWEILLLTFTNKSAKEMLERVENLTNIPAHTFWGGTFHHIGQKCLRMHGDLINLGKNFNILDESDAESLLTEVIREKIPGFLKNKENPKVKVIKDILSYSYNTLQTITQTLEEKYPYLNHFEDEFLTFESLYQKRKLEKQLVDYDDLLTLWLKLLQTQTNIRETYQSRFRYILVDEYQDTNALQSSIIDILAKDHQIMAVGDDAQCIYTWRGANIDNILEFPNRHPGTIIHKIQTNYRSTPNILNLANNVLDQQYSGFKKELKSIRNTHKAPYIITTIDTREQAQFIIRRVHGLVQEGVQLSDIAILYRAHYQAMDLQMELSRQQIPFQITSGVRFFEQAHIKDLIAQLRFLSNPHDHLSFIRFTSLLPKLGPKTAEKILGLAQKLSNQEGIRLSKALENKLVLSKVPEASQEIWIDIAYTFQDLEDNLGKVKPEALVKIIIDGWYSDYLKNIYPNWRTRQDDLDSLCSFASRYENLAELLGQLMLLSSEVADRSLDEPLDSIRLSTIHQSKGLEFPIVFIIGLSDNLFPLKRAIEEGDTHEELRLFYVAITRAKDELYLLHPKITSQNGPPALLSPSRFLNPIDPDLYETLHFKPR